LPDASGNDVSHEIIFTFNGTSGSSSQHVDLAYVSERIGYPTLEKLLWGTAQRLIRSKVILDSLQASEKPLHLLWPGKRIRVMPCLFAFAQR